MSANSKKYSLLQEELEDFIPSDNEGFKNKLFNSFYKRIMNNRDVRYSFLVPSAYYLRGEMLCEDISIQDNGISFTHSDLINLLFNDFLANVRILSDHESIYSGLMARDRRSLLITINGQNSGYSKVPDNLKEIEFVLKRRSALRLEVFLADLAELYPDNPFSVEDVLQIMYFDFIYSYKTGQMRKIVETITKNLSDS